MEIKDLKVNPENPRTITDKKLAALKRALAEFGDLGGFVFNRKTQRLVGGHQRAKLFDENALVTIEKKYSKPTRTGTVAEGHVLFMGEKFRYREVAWDSTKEKAANIAANKGAGEWDNARLSQWFSQLEDLCFDVDLTLFDQGEREQIEFSVAGENKKKEDKPDARGDGTPEYLLVLECDCEETQQALFERFSQEGLKCKIM